MGLDSVELIVEIENTFQITITDNEAESIRTVGEFYDLILKKIDYSKNHQCKSQVLFYKVREVLSRHCEVKKKSISPNTELSELFENETIKIKWREIQEEFKFKIPDLRRSDVLSKILNWSTFFLVSTTLILIYFAFRIANYALILYSVSFILITYFSWLFTRPLKLYPCCKDMRELILRILPLNYKSADLSIKDKNDVLNVLKYLIHDKIGVDLEEITLDARFVDDLGLS